MADVKVSFFQDDTAIFRMQKRHTIFSMATKAIGSIAFVALGAELLYREMALRKTNLFNELSIGDRLRGQSSDRIPQTVYYQLNLSQSWRNPGKSNRFCSNTFY